MERRIEDERTRVEAEYRRVLKSSVEFEKRIRDRWRRKCRAKNERIAELEARVAELESRLGETAVGNEAARKIDGHGPAMPS
jgi:hypothetical protein